MCVCAAACLGQLASGMCLDSTVLTCSLPPPDQISHTSVPLHLSNQHWVWRISCRKSLRSWGLQPAPFLAFRCPGVQASLTRTLHRDFFHSCSFSSSCSPALPLPALLPLSLQLTPAWPAHPLTAVCGSCFTGDDSGGAPAQPALSCWPEPTLGATPP